MSKRLHYFNHQFLVAQDFLDEQNYHLSMRRNLNRELHSAGIVSGLFVKQEGSREITVEKGFALDRDGRELILSEHARHEVRVSDHHGQIHVVLVYEDRFENTGEQFEGRDSGGAAAQGFDRVAETAQVKLTRSLEEAGSGVLLGTVHLNAEGNISKVDHSGRPAAGSLIAPNGVHTKHLADGSVTEPKLAADVLVKLNSPQFTLPDESVTFNKLSPELRSAMGARGWVRMPFRPERLKTKTARYPATGEGDFSLDVEFAHCDGRGARGSMAIPVPAGATRIQEFRIAGSTKREVTIELLRTGWNQRDRKGESTMIVKKELRNAIFDEKMDAERELDEFHALTVAVHSTGESEIWLVAARFE